MVEAVLKIGGSLSEYPQNLKKLCRSLAGLSKTYRFVITPGGGRFADAVRRLYRKFHLSDEAAHKMAILAVDQYGLLLSDIIPDSRITQSLQKARVLVHSGFPTVFLPSKLLFAENPLEESWSVTSDTVSAYVAYRLNARRLILVKDVDGIFTGDPKLGGDVVLLPRVSVYRLQASKTETCVDTKLPEFLIKSKLRCYVVNGRMPRRVERILANKPTICSEVFV